MITAGFGNGTKIPVATNRIISFNLDMDTSDARIVIYNVLGQPVRTIKVPLPPSQLSLGEIGKLLTKELGRQPASQEIQAKMRFCSKNPDACGIDMSKEGIYPAGSYNILWDGRNDSGEKVAAGKYYQTVFSTSIGYEEEHTTTPIAHGAGFTIVEDLVRKGYSLQMALESLNLPIPRKTKGIDFEILAGCAEAKIKYEFYSWKNALDKCADDVLAAQAASTGFPPKPKPDETNYLLYGAMAIGAILLGGDFL